MMDIVFVRYGVAVEVWAEGEKTVDVDSCERVSWSDIGGVGEGTEGREEVYEEREG